MSLPERCEDCLFFARERCRRHAPPSADEEFQIAGWPQPPPQRRCGEGVSAADPEDAQCVPCRDCIYWFSPKGGIHPSYRRGRQAEWWAGAGYCTRHAPSPSGEDGGKAYFRITHGAESACGGGELVDWDIDPTTGEML